MLELARVFLTLGAAAFGGPLAHIALMQRELVERRRWLDNRTFLDVLALANLLPGPTSTEVAMHIGWRRAGLSGLIVAGVAFILPAALMVTGVAFAYVRFGTSSMLESILRAVQPVVIVVIVQAVLPLGRAAVTSGMTVGLAVLAAFSGQAVGELAALIGCGVLALLWPRGRVATCIALLACGGAAVVAQEAIAGPTTGEVAAYFARIGALLVGSGYVLLPVLHGDLVGRLHWLTERQLLDAIAAGQATPGPVFTTATFIGYLLGGASGAAAATLAIFAPAFVFSAVAAPFHERVRSTAAVQRFLAGVNAAAIGLLVVALASMARAAWFGWDSVVLAAAATASLFWLRINTSLVLVTAALVGILSSIFGF